MDRLTTYKALVKQIICSLAKDVPYIEGVRTELVIDDVKGHYELLEVGWQDTRRVHGLVIHCDIMNDKIYVEHDGTSEGVVDMLLEKGVPHKDIVVGFHAPDLRKYTPFAQA